MKKILITLMCGIITVGILGCGSTTEQSNNDAASETAVDSTALNDEISSNENDSVLIDARNLGNYSLDDINKFINKEPEKVSDYKYVYNPLTDEEVIFDDTNNSIIYLSYDLSEEDKVKEYDKDKLFKKFGIDITGSNYSDLNGMLTFKNIKDFGDGEISLFKNSDGYIENIVFYPQSINSFNSFLDRIK